MNSNPVNPITSVLRDWCASVGPTLVALGRIRSSMKYRLLSILFAGALLAPVRAAELAANAAAIRSVRAVGNQLVVTVEVPTGKRRLTLESRSRLARGAWTPREVRWSQATEAGELTFTLPLIDGMEMLRVRDENEAEMVLPAEFFSGPKDFAPLRQSESGALQIPLGPGGVVTFDGATPSGVFPLATETATSRTVVESDIWKLDGRTLYFFNQQRGLQVIDLTDADHPTVTGTLPLAVAGEQMYRLPAVTNDGSVWLALLAQQGCNGYASEVLLVNVKAGRPALASRLPVRGQIKETRLVGNALYLATYDWFQPQPREGRDPDGNVISGESLAWESRSIVSAFDLADPAHPVVQPTVELAVSPDAIAATDKFLFLATTGTRTPAENERLPAWVLAGNHAVIIFDLADPHGAVNQLGFFLTAGRVADKFKLGQLGTDGTALAVVSQVDGINRPVSPTDPDNPVETIWEWVPPKVVVETFSLADPVAPAPLAQLTLVTNESVFATRFAGDRAYVVTFRRVDPLWILDLSDPSHPAIKGELQIPGYSTYLQPLADNSRLLALGVDSSRTTVQLFDVADPAKAALLSKVFLGEGWSWSEGNSDEKAFQVFPEAGLALVPWQGQRSGDQPGQWFQGLQLIDFDLHAGSLRARGVIDHALQARRATLLGDRIVSVSAQELLSVNATDRDHPKAVAALALSTQVDRVFVRGQDLIEIRNSGALPAQVSLSPISSPESPRASLALDSLPIIGADLRGDRLFVLQFRADGWTNEVVTVDRPVIKSVPQPPVREWHTNWVVMEVPPPLVQIEVTHIVIRDESWPWGAITNVSVQWQSVPLPIATNIVTTVFIRPLPPVPTAPEGGTYTLTWIRPEFTPQPSTLATNAVVTSVEIPQPPLLITNWITESTSQPVRVPGESRLSIVEVGASTLGLASQLSFENPTDFYGAALTALWPGEDTLVWTELANSQGWPVLWTDVLMPTVGNLGGPIAISSPAEIGFITAMPAIRFDFWWGPWWGSTARNYLAFEVADPARPILASRTRLGGTDWNSFSDSFVADGKVFVSHRVSQYIPAPETSVLVTNLNGVITSQPLWQPGTWEHHYFLDVLDFSDAAEPAIRAPVTLPGSLIGVSHGGQLVYAEGADQADATANGDPNLHALAYDGLEASLVASFPLPRVWPKPLLVRGDGQVLLGKAAPTTNDAPSLETWAVSTAGTFERYATATLAAAAEEIHSLGDLLVLPAGDRFHFFTLNDAPALVHLGSGDRFCNLWFDWASAAASPLSGLWLPRGAQGLWQVTINP
ncbi:MAG TPA: beta-propeller domain-containing protein [Verrucomicrobiota bacterium]|nr:hypothetical protein [Verrucomicrobiales bacterium]HRI16409.1 beta-propeller domain-containing protein [Verrucomicrobiota bacterium]